MKNRFLALILNLIPILSFGQFGSQNVLTSDLDGPWFVEAADLDNDSKIDIIACSLLNDKIVWFQNEGNGFSSEIVISTDANGARCVRAADLDNDGDLDIIAALDFDDQIIWFQNNMPNGFSDKIIISDQGNRPLFVYPIDIDNDNDIDVISTAWSSDLLSLHVNNGNGSFADQIVISDELDGVKLAGAADFDGDDRLDLFACTEYTMNVSWFKNLGNNTFGTENVLSTDVNNAREIYAVDLDGDGLADLVTLDSGFDKIIWNKNLGNGLFEDEQIIGGFSSVSSMKPADVDLDGDMDIIAGGNTSLVWYENNGDGTLGSVNTISNEVDNIRSIQVIDILNNQFPEVISASFGDDKITWYSNLSTSTIVDVEHLNINVYPNPANDKIFIKSIDLKNYNVEIMNALGKTLMSRGNTSEINISHLKSGIYFLIISSTDLTQSFVQRIVID